MKYNTLQRIYIQHRENERVSDQLVGGRPVGFLYFSLIFRQISLRSGIRVKNVSGTGDDKPQEFGTWKKFYTEGGGLEWPRLCRVKGCQKPADGGGHVVVEFKDSDVYIVPMCGKEHNTAQNMDWLPIKQNTVALRVDEEDTKRPLDSGSPAVPISFHNHRENTTRPAENQGIYRRAEGQGIYRPAENQGIHRPAENQGIYRPAENQGIYRPAENQGIYRPAENQGIYLPAENLEIRRPAEIRFARKLDTSSQNHTMGRRSESRTEAKNVCCQCIIV